VTEETHAESDLGPVRATIVVTADPGGRRGPVRVRSRAGSALAIGVLAGAVAVVAIALALRSVHRALPADHPPPAVASTDRESTMFGFRVDCPRLALVSPDGQYARADYEMNTPCGSYGNYVTLILHRVGGSWVQVFVGTGWRCPSRSLPPRVLTELQLCPLAEASSATRPQRPQY
jgi:hypothetical protein